MQMQSHERPLSATPRLCSLPGTTTFAVGFVAALLVALLSSTTTPAHAGPSTWTVTTPGALAGPTATLQYDDADGTVSLAVSRDGQQVLRPSPLGIETESADLTAGLRFVGRTDRAVVERYTTTVGKRLERRAMFQEARFAFAGENEARLELVVRVSADGVAYRYHLPRDNGAVRGEASAFRVAEDSEAWLANHRRDYENPFVQTTAGGADAREYMTPALFKVGGTYLMVAESDLDGSYSGARLAHNGTGTYRVKLWDDQVAVDGSLTTPWRTMVVGDLETVAESTLVDDIAPASRLSDTDWIRPGQVLWTWIAGGRAAGQSLEMQKEYVDYAAERGWPYVAVDAGWYFDPDQWDVTDPNWQETSWMPELVRYAEHRRVDIITWIHYRDLDTAAERSEWLPTLEDWGVKGVKIDFMDSESQEMLQWYDEILPATARHHLLVNFHGSTIPKGIHRTWPHVMTMEGVHGQEKGSRVDTSHLTALPYTRNVVGSMDYTPMAFHRDTRPTTDAHELGLSVVFESGLQNLAGTPESYDARPEARRFLEQVPAVWDETELLAGTPGDSTVIARRDGDRWFLGGSFSGAARTVDVPLELPGRSRWLLELVRDGANGLVREHRVLRSGDVLSVDVLEDGGFAATACPWHEGRTTCDEPVDAIPATTLRAEPGEVQVRDGEAFEVKGTFTVDDTEPVTDVQLAPRVPNGWSVEGAPVAVRRLEPGRALRGSWTVTPPAAPDTADPVEVPVVASFSETGHAGRVEDQDTVEVTVLPPGWIDAVEAESSGNDMSGAVRAGGCQKCSGGEKIRFIGNDPANFLRVNGLTVGTDGEYILRFDYTVDGTRSFFVSVNGGHEVELPVSGSSWDEPATVTVPVSLQAGDNSVRFFNDGTHAPDLDRVVITRNGG